MTLWPIATAAAAAALLAGSALGAGRAPSSRPAAAGGTGTSSAQAEGRVRAGVVLSALDNPFFVAVYAGTREASPRSGVATTVRSVTSVAETREQASQLRAAVAQGADCYVVNPITATNLVGALAGVRQPVVNVDSALDATAARRARVRVATSIGTDDFAAGRLAGQHMVAALGGRGDVALLGGLAANANSGLRLRGFASGLGGSRVRVVARATADWDRTKAAIATRRILRAHPGVTGFLAASDLMALGIADAVRAEGRAGATKVVGLDGIPEAMDAVRRGTLSATVSQYPYVMGEMAIEACAAAARGRRLPARVHSPIALLTRDNVDRAIAAFPRPIARYTDPFR